MKYYDANSKLELQRSFINGEYVSNKSGKTFETIHPGNNQAICQVESAGQTEVDLAVASSKAAFEQWSKTPVIERCNILKRAGQILLERNEELAQLETLDTGKAITETREVDIITGVEVMDYYAGVAPSIHGDYMDFPPNAYATIRREPIGVCVGIGAWNYPIQIAMWKSSPALACGNTMVFKPSELTPLTALKLAEIYREAGLPDGVFNVIQGERDTGALLVSHTDVSKVSLTGSVPTGKKIMEAAAQTLKKVTLELGGKSPIIVFDDATLENAINAVVTNNFYSTGQVCSNGTRVFVQRGIYEKFVEQLKIKTSAIKVGDPFLDDTDLGPLVSTAQYGKVMQYLSDAKNSKANHIIGGDSIDLNGGNYLSPAVFGDCTDDMNFVIEEVFGPLMSVLPFDTEQEAVSRANDTNFGLSGAVFTNDFNRANRVANAIQAGSVWINDYNALPASVPFGGYKQSGIGRENGMAAIEHYTQIKMIYANMGDVEATY